MKTESQLERSGRHLGTVIPGIAEAFEKVASTHPDKAALRDRTTSYTYAELLRTVRRMASSLAGIGLDRGDTCLVMLDNHADHVVATMALAVLGAIEVPINSAYRGAVLERLLDNCPSTVLVAESRHVETLVEAGLDLGGVRAVVRGPGGRDTLPWPDDTGAEWVGEPVGPECPGSIIYTSGTTGHSKGVLTSNAQAVSFSVEAPWVDEDDVVLVVLPLFHIGGKWAGVFASLLTGATAVVVERFSTSGFWSDVREFGCTQVMLLGSMPLFLMNQPADDRDRDHPLRRAVFAPITSLSAQFATRFGLEIATCYALTEGCNPIITPYGSTRPGLAGRARKGFEARIVDSDDFEVPDGVSGQLVLRSERPWNLMMGYWNNPVATVVCWRNQWLHTGDFARRTADGEFEFVGRASDVVRRRGENVSTYEVEIELNGHDAVLESAVVGVKQADGEDELMAVVVQAAEVTEGELIEHLRGRLPYFMVPRFIMFVDELPKTSTGKAMKPDLARSADAAWDGETHGYTITGKNV